MERPSRRHLAEPVILAPYSCITEATFLDEIKPATLTKTGHFLMFGKMGNLPTPRWCNEST